MQTTKVWYQSKTLWIALAQGVIGVLVVVQTSNPDLGWIVIVKSVLDIYIRSITTTALSTVAE